MITLPQCPQCNSEYVYKEGVFLICPECAYEWKMELTEQDTNEPFVVKDAHGNLLHDGDTVTVIKDLKVKGSSLVVKVGTRVKNIKLVDADHNIDCKIDGIGSMQLKSEYVKKA